MISVDLARRLLSEGVLWEPQPGDRFMIDQPTLLDEVFWISELTIDVHTYQGQPILGFNGTTEWALDSVTLDKAIWLPRDAQQRDLLGWCVPIATADGGRLFSAGDAEDAYALALLSFV